MLISDTNGSTWKVGGLVAEGYPVWGDECQVALLENARGGEVLVMSARHDANNQSLSRSGTGRGIAFSTDLGDSFAAAALDPTLPDAICAGSLVSLPRVGFGSAGGGLLSSNVWSGADSPAPDWRGNLTISYSASGRGWRHILHIWRGVASYSSMVVLPAETLPSAGVESMVPDCRNGSVAVLYNQYEPPKLPCVGPKEHPVGPTGHGCETKPTGVFLATIKVNGCAPRSKSDDPEYVAASPPPPSTCGVPGLSPSHAEHNSAGDQPCCNSCRWSGFAWRARTTLETAATFHLEHHGETKKAAGGGWTPWTDFRANTTLDCGAHPNNARDPIDQLVLLLQVSPGR